MKTLVILSPDDKAKLARDEIVALFGTNEDVLVIMSEKCHEEYEKDKSVIVNFGLKS